MTETRLAVVQTSVEWKMRNFVKETKERNAFLSSPTFSLANHQFFLRIYPNGDITDNLIPLCLFKERWGSGLHVSFTLGQKKGDGSVLKSVSCTKVFDRIKCSEGSEFFKNCDFLQSKDLVAILDGQMIVFCTMHVVGDSFQEAVFRTPPADSLENFKDLFLSASEREVKIVVKDREFQAHKSVLTVRSPVFESMFKHNMIENDSGVVNITDCDPDTFEDFLYFLYSGELDCVSPINAMSLYLTAEKYDLKDLKIACSKCLARNLFLDTICDVLHFAVLYDDSELFKFASIYFILNAHSILRTSKWEEFLKEHSSVGNKLFIETLTTYTGGN